MAKEKEFIFPEDLLERINEMSSAGYFLMTFDAGGNAVTHSQMDNPICALAFQRHLDIWMQALNKLTVEAEMQNILESSGVKKRRKK